MKMISFDSLTAMGAKIGIELSLKRKKGEHPARLFPKELKLN